MRQHLIYAILARMLMPSEETGWAPANVNRALKKRLASHVDDLKIKGLPHSTDSDILNSLLLAYLLEVYPNDKMLLEIDRIVKGKEMSIHKAASKVFEERSAAYTR